MREYYDGLRDAGHPFDPTSAAPYSPLDVVQLKETLYDFKTKSKTSPVMQVADLALWPMCIGGYDPNNLSFVTMRQAGTLVDCKLAADDVAKEGIKYSCWEFVDRR